MSRAARGGAGRAARACQRLCAAWRRFAAGRAWRREALWARGVAVGVAAAEAARRAGHALSAHSGLLRCQGALLRLHVDVATASVERKSADGVQSTKKKRKQEREEVWLANTRNRG